MSPTGKSFRSVSFVRACGRAVWLLSGIRSQKTMRPLSRFPFGTAELFLFPFVSAAILLSLVS